MFTANFKARVGSWDDSGPGPFDHKDTTTDSSIWAEAHQEGEFGLAFEARAFYDGRAKPGEGHPQIDTRVETTRTFLVDGSGTVNVLIKGTVSSQAHSGSQSMIRPRVRMVWGDSATEDTITPQTDEAEEFSKQVELRCGTLFPIGFRVNTTVEPTSGEFEVHKVMIKIESVTLLFDSAPAGLVSGQRLPSQT